MSGLATQLSPIIQDYHAHRQSTPLSREAGRQTVTVNEAEVVVVPTPAEVEAQIAKLPDTDACYLVSRGRNPGIYATK